MTTRGVSLEQTKGPPQQPIYLGGAASLPVMPEPALAPELTPVVPRPWASGPAPQAVLERSEFSPWCNQEQPLNSADKQRTKRMDFMETPFNTRLMGPVQSRPALGRLSSDYGCD